MLGQQILKAMKKTLVMIAIALCCTSCISKEKKSLEQSEDQRSLAAGNLHEYEFEVWTDGHADTMHAFQAYAPVLRKSSRGEATLVCSSNVLCGVDSIRILSVDGKTKYDIAVHYTSGKLDTISRMLKHHPLLEYNGDTKKFTLRMDLENIENIDNFKIL